MFVTVEEEEEEEAAAKGASSINSQDPWLPFQSLSLSLSISILQQQEERVPSGSKRGKRRDKLKQSQEERQLN